MDPLGAPLRLIPLTDHVVGETGAVFRLSLDEQESVG